MIRFPCLRHCATRIYTSTPESLVGLYSATCFKTKHVATLKNSAFIAFKTQVQTQVWTRCCPPPDSDEHFKAILPAVADIPFIDRDGRMKAESAWAMWINSFIAKWNYFLCLNRDVCLASAVYHDACECEPMLIDMSRWTVQRCEIWRSRPSWRCSKKPGLASASSLVEKSFHSTMIR